MSTTSLEAVLNEWEHDAETLARCGQIAQADQLRARAKQVREATEEWLDTLTEGEAALFSGQSTRWLAARFESYARRGLAFRRGRTRVYRRCALPRRAETVAAYVAGQVAAQQSRAV
jgi:hypothetical protein